MIDVHSEVDGRLLARYFTADDHCLVDGRRDLVSPIESLQVAALHQTSYKSFPPHKHLEKDIHAKVSAQESWVVIAGEVTAYVYDLDGKILKHITLLPGDCIIFIAGGHAFDVKPRTFCYEFKSGPYPGREKDKVLLDDTDH